MVPIAEIGKGTIIVVRASILAMLRDEPEMTMDMKVLGQMTLSDINMDTLHGYSIGTDILPIVRDTPLGNIG